jgi:hypothetical protein
MLFGVDAGMKKARRVTGSTSTDCFFFLGSFDGLLFGGGLEMDRSHTVKGLTHDLICECGHRNMKLLCLEVETANQIMTHSR